MSNSPKSCGHALYAAAFLAASCLLSAQASATQYDTVQLSSQGVAHAINNGVAAGGDVTGLPTVWTNNGTTTTHLPLPAGSSGATVLGIWGNQVGGYGGVGTDRNLHALLWNGTSSLPVDLGAFSQVNGIYNGIQVGTNSADDAVLWRGTAASQMSLSPIGASFFTEPTGIWGNEISGRWHGDPSGSDPHAVVWTSLSPSGFVDLTLPSYLKSDALGVARGQVAGWAGIAGTKHAAIWANTAASFQDLAPAGTTASELWGTNGVQQVGDVSFLPGGGSLPVDSHAAVWRGTAASYQLLPGVPGRNFSIAFGIDGSGNIVGEAGQQVAGSIGQFVPVLWTPHRLAGDVNFDGTVNFSDLLTLSQHYGQPGEWVDGEFNGGGTVNFGDLLTLAQNYGRSQSAAEAYTIELPSTATIPESSDIVLLSVGSASMIRLRAAGASSS